MSAVLQLGLVSGTIQFPKDYVPPLTEALVLCNTIFHIKQGKECIREENSLSKLRI